MNEVRVRKSEKKLSKKKTCEASLHDPLKAKNERRKKFWIDRKKKAYKYHCRFFDEIYLLF